MGDEQRYMAMSQALLNNSPDEYLNVSDKQIEVYLDHCSMRGTLLTGHGRVSDHLAATEEILRLSNAQVVMRDGTMLENAATALVNKSEILFVVDLSPTSGGRASFHVERDHFNVVLNVGPIWLQGRAHVPVGAELHAFFAGTMNRFMAITDATIVGHATAKPRTVLINRDQLRCMVTVA
jgi:hypothetical protein